MEIQEIKEELNRLRDIINDLWKQSLELPPEDGWDWYIKRSEHGKYKDLYREYKLKLDKKDIDMEPIPDYGDLMTLEEFIDSCECGGFIDYDGDGYYSTGTEMSTLEISPSDVIAKKFRKDFTHVVWFNR